MPLNLSILYRGPLSSCNYDCSYCPFAKRHETAAQLAVDKRSLEKFLSWSADWPSIADEAEDTLSVFFTPWGEALTRRWYRDAIVQLSRLSHIRKVAVQTNLSCDLDWLQKSDKEKVGLWCTFHPTQVDQKKFLAQCYQLDVLGVRYSVGVVGLKEHFEDINKLRQELSPNVYLWINAYKRRNDYYSASDAQMLKEIDPLFSFNTQYHASMGRACRAGETAVSVDGDGNVRRCHFITEPLGNLYQSNIRDLLAPRPCTQPACGCHIGYVHLYHLNLYEVFGNGMLERIPKDPIRRR